MQVALDNANLEVNEYCDINIQHEILSYNEFIEKIKDKDLETISFDNTKIQKYLLKIQLTEKNIN